MKQNILRGEGIRGVNIELNLADIFRVSKVLAEIDAQEEFDRQLSELRNNANQLRWKDDKKAEYEAAKAEADKFEKEKNPNFGTDERYKLVAKAMRNMLRGVPVEFTSNIFD